MSWDTEKGVLRTVGTVHTHVRTPPHLSKSSACGKGCGLRPPLESGGRVRAPIGVPWRLRCFSSFSTFSSILF